jgi:hypothetical protein
VVEKLHQKIRDKEYYEAHQTYRVLYQRYKAQGKEGEALDLLYDGALLLLQNGQRSCGIDLAMLLVDHLKEQKTPVSDQWLEKIGNLFCQYSAEGVATPPSSGTTGSEPMDSSSAATADGAVFEIIPGVDGQEGLIRAALKWSSMVGEQWRYGHPKLHKVAALEYWKEKQYVKAREHFLYAEHPQEFGCMLVELATTFGYSGEADLFITQAVLQLLVLKDRKGGLAVFNAYTRKHPRFKSDNPPYIHHPTLNFVWFLLSACKDHSKEVFTFLRANYAPSISRDPTFNEYLDKIGETYFGPPNQSRQAGGSAVPGPSGIFGAGGLIEGILSSLSNVLPQAAGMASATGPMGPHPTIPPTSAPPAQGTSQTLPPRSTFSHHMGPIEFGPGGQISQTQHIHLGTVQLPPPGDIPPEGIQLDAPLSGLPFALPPGAIPFVGPGNIRFRPPQINIRFRPPRSQAANPNPSRPQHGAGRVVIPRPAPGANIRLGPPRAGHISVVGFRMEGVPIHMSGGAALGLGNGPVITPEQQQLYQQHAQQQQAADDDAGGGQQNSTEGGQWNFPDDPPPPPSDDMELD